MRRFTFKRLAFLSSLALLLCAMTTQVQAQTILLADGFSDPIACSPATFGPTILTNTSDWEGEVAYLGRGELACEPISGDFTDKYLMIDRGDCNFVTKVLNAQNAGATGVIIISQDTRGLRPLMVRADNADQVTIPSVCVSLVDGARLINALENGAFNVRFSGVDVFEPVGEPIWSEDFDGGLGDWTTENNGPGGDTAIWVHQDQPFSAWTTSFHVNSPTSVLNGVAAFDAANFSLDEINAGLGLPDYTARLESPEIDVQGADALFLTFYTCIFELNQANFPDPQISVAIARDGETFDEVIPLQTENVFTSLQINWIGTETFSFLLTDLNGTSRLKLRFQFDGDMYYFAVDDIALRPVPEYNGAIIESSYPLFSEVAPAAHIGIDTFGMQAVIRNEGTQSDDPFILDWNILDESGSSVASQSVTRNVDAFAFDTVLLDRFVPNLPVGSYTMRYNVSLNSQQDAIEGDSEQSYTFRVSENTFQKEDLPADGIIRGAGSDENQWFYGEHYLISDQADDEDRVFAGAQVAFQSREDTVFDDGEVATLYLIKWVDDNDGVPAQAEFVDGESPISPAQPVEVVAFADVELSGDEYQLIDVLMPADNTQDPVWFNEDGDEVFRGDIILDGNAVYGVWAELNNEVGLATDLRRNPQTVTSLLWNSNGEGTYFGGGFVNTVPVIRLVVGEFSSTSDVNNLSEDVARIYPTVTEGMVTLQYDFETATSATYRLIGADGRIVNQVDLGELSGQGEQPLNLGNQANGYYQIQLNTEEGVLTTPVIISK